MSFLSSVRVVGSSLSLLALSVACGGNTESTEGTGGEAAGTGGMASGSGGSLSTGGTNAAGGSGAGGSGTGGGKTVDRSCEVASDCALVSASCCGTCGAPTVEDMTAVSVEATGAHRDAVCDDDAICPACAAFPNPNLYASCESGACVARDLATEVGSECAQDSDCQIRAATCCECGAGTGPGELVAINPEHAGDYLSSLCEPDTGCAQCLPAYPPEASAVCDTGHCKVVDSRSPY